LKVSFAVVGIVLLVTLFTSARSFAACICSDQLCISEQESGLYLACVASSQGAGLPVGYTSSSAALFKAIAKSQTAQFSTKCGTKSVPLLPALTGQKAFQTGQTISSSVKAYSGVNHIHKRDAWASFETMTPAQCLTAAQTIP
jgi:hypothetical protein